MMYKLLILLNLVLGQDLYPDCAAQDNSGICTVPVCPDCSLIDCFPELEPEDCPSGTLLTPDLSAGGCCPACVKYLDQGQKCVFNGYEKLLMSYLIPCTNLYAINDYWSESETKVMPIIEALECGGTTECDSASGTCVIDSSSICSKAGDSYDTWLDGILNQGQKCETMQWLPECNEYGLYQPTQAKVNLYHPQRRKYCTDPEGKLRLFGDADFKDDEMLCGCSRKHWELAQTILSSTAGLVVEAREDVTLHCDPKGNYEPLQCDQGRCWCVDELSGKATSGVVVESLVSFLFCFNPDTFGSQYLRRCESRRFGKAQSRRKLAKHGLEWDLANDVTCDFDGSFGLVTCEGVQCRCVNPFNQVIGNYFASASKRREMECQCARDEWNGYTSLQCQLELGGYERVQSLERVEFCVDQDGFQVTGSYKKPQSDSTCTIAQCPERELYCSMASSPESALDPCVDCELNCV